MSDFTLTALAAAALAATSLSLARARLAASSVITHWASHGQLLDDPKAGAVAAELAGVAAFGQPLDGYHTDHRLHHGNGTMVTTDGDPDTVALFRLLGLAPGLPYPVLRRRVVFGFVSPRVHGLLFARRLAHTFGADQPRWRRITATGLWGGLAAASVAGGWAGALVLGLVLPLAVGGNIASLAQQLSEHFHGLAEPQGRPRQLALSHGRHPLTWLPEPQAPWWQWALMPARLALAAAARFVFLPVDLPRHVDHHAGTRRAAQLHRWAWPNAADEFTPRLMDDDALAQRNFPGVWPAIRAGLMALAAEPAQPIAN